MKVYAVDTVEKYGDFRGKKILVHPNNMGVVTQALKEAGCDSLLAGPIPGVVINECHYVPERNIEEVWHPPESERFVEYDQSDEKWMRPLGLGSVEQVDKGACVWVVDAGLFNFQFRPSVFW